MVHYMIFIGKKVVSLYGASPYCTTLVRPKKQNVHRFTHYIHEDNDGRKLSLKYFCLMCNRFRIISEIRSNNEFLSREMKTTAIRMNTKMLNAFLLFSRKRNNEMS